MPLIGVMYNEPDGCKCFKVGTAKERDNVLHLNVLVGNIKVSP